MPFLEWCLSSAAVCGASDDLGLHVPVKKPLGGVALHRLRARYEACEAVANALECAVVVFEIGLLYVWIESMRRAGRDDDAVRRGTDRCGNLDFQKGFGA
jgi:hypothetical protein